MTEEKEPTTEELKADLIIARVYVTVLQQTIQEMVHPPDQPLDREDQRLQIRVFEDDATAAKIIVRELQVMVKGVRALLGDWSRPSPEVGRFGPPANWQERIGKLLESDDLGWPGGLPEWTLETEDGVDVTRAQTDPLEDAIKEAERIALMRAKFPNAANQSIG